MPKHSVQDQAALTLLLNPMLSSTAFLELTATSLIQVSSVLPLKVQAHTQLISWRLLLNNSTDLDSQLMKLNLQEQRMLLRWTSSLTLKAQVTVLRRLLATTRPTEAWPFGKTSLLSTKFPATKLMMLSDVFYLASQQWLWPVVPLTWFPQSPTFKDNLPEQKLQVKKIKKTQVYVIELV